jgi:DNA-binding MurR/RpiR family transcriptional regulator
MTTKPVPPPQSDLDLRAVLADRQSSLPPRLKQIAAYVVQHPEDIAFATVAELAARCGVQPSAIIRFCKAIGFAGYGGLQALCRQSLRGQDHAARLDRLQSNEQAGGATAGFVEASILSLRKLRPDDLDRALDAASNALQQVSFFHIVGFRRMFSVAAYLSYSFSVLGLRTQLVDQAGGLGPDSVTSFRTGDGMIAVSFSPYASQTLAIAAMARDAGIPVVSITDSPLSPLASLSQAMIEVVEADHAGFRSLAATMTVASALATRLAGDRKLTR